MSIMRGRRLRRSKTRRVPVQKSERGERRLDHCLGFAREVFRRVLINREGVSKVAEQCQQAEQAFESIIRIHLHCRRCPSDERLACIAMNDPTLTDEDIGDIFGRTTRWGFQVRAHRAEFEEAEPIPEELCWFVGHITKTDPMPDVIRHRCARVQAMGVLRGRDVCQTNPAIRQFFGANRNGALIFRSAG